MPRQDQNVPPNPASSNADPSQRADEATLNVVLAAIKRTRGDGRDTTAHAVWFAIGTMGLTPRPSSQEGFIEVLRELGRGGRIKITAGHWNAPLTKICITEVEPGTSGATE
jgi:hypothetical protein